MYGGGHGTRVVGGRGLVLGWGLGELRGVTPPKLGLERGDPFCEFWRLRWKNQDLGEEVTPRGQEPIRPRLWFI